MFGWKKKQPLAGIRVAVLAADGVELAELREPWKTLHKAGAELYLIGLRTGKIQPLRGLTPVDKISVDATVDEVNPASFAALLLPGGLANLDRLRQNEQVRQFVRAFARTGKPIAALSRAPWILASAGVLEGKTLTSAAAIQDDIRNAGAYWENAATVVDGNLLTSRGAKDLKQFNKQVVTHFAQVVNAG